MSFPEKRIPGLFAVMEDAHRKWLDAWLEADLAQKIYEDELAVILALPRERHHEVEAVFRQSVKLREKTQYARSAAFEYLRRRTKDLLFYLDSVKP